MANSRIDLAMNEVWYDNEEDVLGIQVVGKYRKNVEVSRNVVADVSNDRKTMGVEIFKAKRQFKKDAPLVVAKASSRPRQ